MASLVQCSGCLYNFSTQELFNAHRVGSYGETIYGPREHGKSPRVIGRTPMTRRCMTAEEMLAKGWTVQVESIFDSSGLTLPTWYFSREHMERRNELRRQMQERFSVSGRDAR